MLRFDMLTERVTVTLTAHDVIVVYLEMDEKNGSVEKESDNGTKRKSADEQ